jgi:hypothetical protein
VIYIETTAFMKTQKRQRAERGGNARLRWSSAPTGPDEHLDELFAHNLRERAAFLAARLWGDAAEPHAAE